MEQNKHDLEEDVLRPASPTPLEDADTTVPTAGDNNSNDNEKVKADKATDEAADEATDEATDEPAAKKPKCNPPPLPPRDAAWDSCVAQVRGHLRSMTADESFHRSMELQVLAQAEIAQRTPQYAEANSNDLPIQMYLSSVLHSQRDAILAKKVAKRSQRQAKKQCPVEDGSNRPLRMTKLNPPIPPYQESKDDPDVEVPSITECLNFPQVKQYKKCVMCGSDQFHIPKQNKGVCINCDSAVWVHNPTGFFLKWCKACKHFRKWSDFGLKGTSTKTTKCREKLAVWYAKKKVIMEKERSLEEQAAEHMAQAAMLGVSAAQELAMVEESATKFVNEEEQQHNAVMQNEEVLTVGSGVAMNV